MLFTSPLINNRTKLIFDVIKPSSRNTSQGKLISPRKIKLDMIRKYPKNISKNCMPNYNICIKDGFKWMKNF